MVKKKNNNMSYVKNFGDFINESDNYIEHEVFETLDKAKGYKDLIGKYDRWIEDSKVKMEKLKTEIEKLKNKEFSLKVIDNKFEDPLAVKYVLTKWEIFKLRASILRYRFEKKKNKAIFNDKNKGTNEYATLRGSDILKSMQRTNFNLQKSTHAFQTKYKKAAGLDTIVYPNIKL